MIRIVSTILICSCLLISGCKNKKSAPDFRLDTISHKRFYLNQHKGKPVVLVFATTFCTPCKKEMIELEALQKKHKNRFILATIIADAENKDVIDHFISSNKLTAPVLLDKSGTVNNRYKISEFPTTVIINSNGAIVTRKVGFDSSTKRFITHKLLQLLEK